MRRPTSFFFLLPMSQRGGQLAVGAVAGVAARILCREVKKKKGTCRKEGTGTRKAPQVSYNTWTDLLWSAFVWTDGISRSDMQAPAVSPACIPLRRMVGSGFGSDNRTCVRYQLFS